ncbi:MAG TPA: retropepsin-like aspartic protease [Vitreimonas sp.]|uniref:retropepsin-like aspartic protease family protein n=1 Tax=Vitreimonas sp. TaxID=3069702 RepID=UPI002D394434|nr:retropepsin-like aspartic protease [Vitreimonas sp.]HYD88853.1 retropepsin-like aspartic protease [Vitreimonas sp.]
MRLSIILAAALLCSACDRLATRTAEYRPQEAGTVDQALCLLGFTGVPLQAAAVTGHHLVEVELNGHTGLFVLDTGANASVIDRRYVERFGLTPGGLQGQAFGVGGGQRAQIAQIESLAIAGVPIRQSRIAVADIAQVADVLGPLTGETIVGIIGQDALTEHRAVIDVARPILYLIEEDEAPAPQPLETCAGEESSD